MGGGLRRGTGLVGWGSGERDRSGWVGVGGEGWVWGKFLYFS